MQLRLLVILVATALAGGSVLSACDSERTAGSPPQHATARPAHEDVSSKRGLPRTHGQGPPCSVFASPSGRAAAAGRSKRKPTSLDGAQASSRPGSVVCLLAGTYEISSPFYVTRSGTPGHPIVYRAFRRRAVLRWTGPRPTTRSYAVVQLANDEHDVQFRGLTIDGAGRASQGLKCDSGARGLAVLDSTIRNTGSAGIATKRCDRVTIVGNLISHTGYDPTVGWSSGVSLNGNVWSDRAPGFHDVVVGNVVSGASDESFHHSEGHGVIVDQSGDGPPVLVADNVVYENGGRCVDAYRSSHVWFVSNTCYADNLDTRLRNVGEIGASVGSDLHFIDNVAYAWAARAPYRIDDATGQFTRNVGYGAGPSLVPRSVIDDQFRVRRVDPLFTAPPAVPPAARGKQRTALPPWEVGIRFVPLPSSPLVGSGVDPRAAVGVTAALRAGMNRYLRTDIRGEPRPKGRGWDIGAYQLP